MENSPQRYTKRMKQRSIGPSSLFRVAPWDWRMWALVTFLAVFWNRPSCLKAPPALKVYGLIQWILDIAIAKCPLRTLPATSIYAQQKSLSSELLVTTVSLSGPYLFVSNTVSCSLPQRFHLSDQNNNHRHSDLHDRRVTERWVKGLHKVLQWCPHLLWKCMRWIGCSTLTHFFQGIADHK